MAFIQINKTNFYHNLSQIALKTGSVEKIAIVLKDNAYGHGLELMAKLASDYGIRHAVVRNDAEANAIKHWFDTVLILGARAKKEKICTYTINTLEDIDLAECGARVELKVDTGMHRNGIMMGELDEALERIQAQGLVLVGVMTHYRSADELSSELFWQQKQFDRIKHAVKEAGFDHVRFHSHNSAALLRRTGFDEDVVRVGIAAYGYATLPEVFDTLELKPVLSLHAKRVSSRFLKVGERIGYGGEFTAPKDMQVSTYDLGYGDGWSRGDVQNPYITAEGVPLLGRVSMDLVILESTQDRVCIMADAQRAATHFGTIPYEMTTALSSDIPRIVIE